MQVCGRCDPEDWEPGDAPVRAREEAPAARRGSEALLLREAARGLPQSGRRRRRGARGWVPRRAERGASAHASRTWRFRTPEFGAAALGGGGLGGGASSHSG